MLKWDKNNGRVVSWNYITYRQLVSHIYQTVFQNANSRTKVLSPSKHNFKTSTIESRHYKKFSSSLLKRILQNVILALDSSQCIDNYISLRTSILEVTKAQQCNANASTKEIWKTLECWITYRTVYFSSHSWRHNDCRTSYRTWHITKCNNDNKVIKKASQEEMLTVFGTIWRGFQENLYNKCILCNKSV